MQVNPWMEFFNFSLEEGSVCLCVGLGFASPAVLCVSSMVAIMNHRVADVAALVGDFPLWWGALHSF